jgi:amidase
MATAWVGRSAARIAEGVRRSEVTARDVVAAHLERIAQLDERVGAFRRVRAKAALAEADAVDGRKDLADLPMAGVPVAVKDNLAVRGEAPRIGSAATPDVPAASDHLLVARLRGAGAVVVGLTNVPELCVFGTSDSVYGIPRSPWDTTRTAGGSSGGSAAAVAAGMVPLALGNDGMGSLRIPAAQCGLLTLKPGFGVVPAGIGRGDWFGMAENGPLATSAEDARLMFGVLAGAHVPEPAGEEERLRVAVSVRSPLPGVPVSREDAAAARAAGEVLAGAGHAVGPADPPYPLWLGAAVLARWTAGAAEDARGLDPGRLARRTRRHAAVGRLAARTPLVTGDMRARLRARLEPFFAEHDVLLTPALARPGPEAAPWHERGWLSNLVTNTRFSPFTPPWNLAGWPALVLPAGRRPGGLPVAVQCVAPPGNEPRLLTLAARFEALQPWPRTAEW